MAQTQIVIADCDEKYLLTLERLFIQEYKFTAEINLISDTKVLKEFFMQPQKIDILLINENLYDDTFIRHNVSYLFVLTEETFESAENSNKLYKYIGGKNLMDNVINKSGISHETNLHSDIATVVMAFSPVGGVGQTTLSVGVCTAMARNFRRTLFISIESLQTFGYLLEDKQKLQAGTEKTLQQKSKYAYEKVKPMIISQLYDILPPFPVSLASLGISQEHFIHLIDLIKSSGDYDYIIVDAGRDFTPGTTSLMSMADRIMIVGTQKEDDTYRVNCLLENIDCSDVNRFVMVCNKYDKEEKDYLENIKDKCPPIKYVEFDSKIAPKNGDYLAKMKSMQALVQIFMDNGG